MGSILASLSLLTSLNAPSLVTEISVLNQDQLKSLRYAFALPFLGMLFDFMDGKVARWTGNVSMLGQELDSLADLVSPC